MYTLKRAYARSQSSGGRWALVDNDALLSTPVSQIPAAYRDLQLIVVSHTAPTVEKRVDFGAVFYDFYPPMGTTTLSGWFTWLNNKALPNVSTVNLELRQAVVANPFEEKAGFHVNTTQAGALPNDSVPDTARRDLLITHPTKAAKLVYDNCLVSVAGFLHYTDYSDWGLYVKEGGVTSAASKQNVVSLISFASLGGVEMIPITPDMIAGLPDEGPLQGPIYLSTGEDVDWSESTAMLSLGGKLLPMGNTFRSIGTGEFELDLLKFPYPQHYQEALEHMDMSTVQAAMPARQNNPTMVSVEGLYSKAAIEACLGMSQSFIIRIKSKGVFVQSDHVQSTAQPGVFITELVPKGLLVSNTNRVLDYIIIKELESYCLQTVSDLSVRRQFWNTDWRNHPGIDGKRPTVRPFDVVQARLLTIGTDVFV